MLISPPRAKWGKICQFVTVCGTKTLHFSQVSLISCSVHILEPHHVSFRRARLVNYIKTTEVIRQPYPLQIRASGPHSYFIKRETWGWTDFLMNPMVKKMADVALNFLPVCDSLRKVVRCLICLCGSHRLWWWSCPCSSLFYCPRWSTPTIQKWERSAVPSSVIPEILFIQRVHHSLSLDRIDTFCSVLWECCMRI